MIVGRIRYAPSRRVDVRPLLLSQVLAYALGSMAAHAATATDTPTAATAALLAAASDAVPEFWLDVRINGLDPAFPVLARRTGDGGLLLRAADLSGTHVHLPSSARVSVDGDDYVTLDALAGARFALDEANQALALTLPAGLFPATQVRGRVHRSADPPPAPLGAYLNYDLSVAHEDDEFSTGALFELGLFNRLGVGTSTFVVRDDGDNPGLVRLESTWTRDLPGRVASLRLGDTISGAGAWGRSVRLGGVQWASNFATQPGLVTFPLPGMSGEAALPSTIDIYINDALRARRDVPAGPFTISDLPAVTGEGVARVVVRDLLGREQSVALPYYASPRLLAQGLDAYSYELGFVRENFGRASNDYGRLAAVGTHRRGFSDTLTGEVHAELLRDQQTLGTSATWLVPSLGVFTGSIAAGRDADGSGMLAGIGFERRGRTLGFGGSLEFTTPGFVQLGRSGDLDATRQRMQAYLSMTAGRRGSLAFTYTRQDFRNREDIDLLGASYSVDLQGIGFLSLSVIEALDSGKGPSLTVTFTRPLGRDLNLNATASADDGRARASVALQRNLPLGTGFGYRMRAEGPDGRFLVGISAQNDRGRMDLEGANADGDTALRARLSGGIAMLGGDTYLSRRIEQGFGVVRVADYPGVRVYVDNQVVGRTNAEGNALVPRLRPYQHNAVRIEQADLPLDAEVGTVELDAVPYLRSGVILDFPVRPSRGAVLTVVLDGGEPLPAGATVRISGSVDEFPAGQRGLVYLAGLAPHNRLSASWRGQSCDFTVLYPDAADAVPDLGTYVCSGVRP